MSKSAKKFLLDEVEFNLSQVSKLKETTENGEYIGVEKSHELQAILNDLRKIKYEILTDSIPQKKYRFVSYEVFITENWGIRHPLGAKLLDIAARYTDAI